MWTLFSTDSAQAGFRLDYMEVYNWGTFHNSIYGISPQGTTSLLTGANGSGKTTWIDALLTLLVPEKRYRFYNQSSGIEKKGDRTEETYVLGNYGDIQEEGKRSTTVQQLRLDKKTVYSILLAHFKNADDESVTVFQTRWFVGGDLKRVYGIALIPLTIKADFTPFDPQGTWRKSLDKKYRRGPKKLIEFPDGPQRYAERLVKLFGMRSTKALPLLNQTVGIKVLGNLDEFIRFHMLEQQNTEDDFIKLREHFQTLLEASRNIDKAAKQIELLEPIRRNSDNLQRLVKQKSHITDLIATGKFWFAEKKVGLIEERVIEQKHDLDLLKEKEDTIQSKLEQKRTEEREVALNIERDEVGQRIKELEKQIRNQEKEKDKRQRKSDQYNRFAQKIEVSEDPDEETFYRTLADLAELKAKTDKQIAEIDDRIYQTKKKYEDCTTRFANGKQELELLTQQANNITGRVAEIRAELCDSIGAKKSEIPFIGELIQVKSDEQTWESAIERLLHNFALRLLVPEEYYDKVNQYVNKTNLQGRIVYHKFKKGEYLDSFTSLSKDSLFYKLEFHLQSIYTSWVEHEIRKQYDHLCTDDLLEFKRCKKAITSSGLVKSSDRHEKDDRSHVFKREHYVLGWDNSEKIKWWKQELRTLDKEVKEIERLLLRESQSKKNREQFKENISKLESYTNYEEIDWKTISNELQELFEERELLEKTSDRIKELKRQQDELAKQIKHLEKEEKALVVEQSTTREDIKNLTADKEKEYAILQLKETVAIDISEKYQTFGQELAEHLQEMTLQTIDQKRQKLLNVLHGEEGKIQSSITNSEKELQKQILKFKNPDEEITSQFKDWRNETYQLPEDTNYVDEYIRLLEKLERDDLPAYKKKFEDYLSTTMIHKIADFNQSLSDWLENIEDSIKALNESLKGINFRKSPEETFIQLKSHNRSNDNVQTFRHMLNEALPDVAYWSLDKENFAQKEAHFTEKIIPLIHKLDEEVEWRKEVIDVRNWKSFYAEEYYRETEKPMKTYMEMGKLSGGEKAQLTYTILGSALAYQFGITVQGLESRSFRFIAVDESFSNQDEEKATYLMDLCKQLHLQLLVVTPSDKIPIVEPYISYVHFVQRIRNRESVLYDMPIRQFQEERGKLIQET